MEAIRLDEDADLKSVACKRVGDSSSSASAMENDMKEITVNLANFLQEQGLTVSMSEGRRIVAMGAVKLNGEVHQDIQKSVLLREGDLIEVGKKQIVVKIGGFIPPTGPAELTTQRCSHEDAS